MADSISNRACVGLSNYSEDSCSNRSEAHDEADVVSDVRKVLGCGVGMVEGEEGLGRIEVYILDRT